MMGTQPQSWSTIIWAAAQGGLPAPCAEEPAEQPGDRGDQADVAGEHGAMTIRRRTGWLTTVSASRVV